MNRKVLVVGITLVGLAVAGVALRVHTAGATSEASAKSAAIAAHNQAVSAGLSNPVPDSVKNAPLDHTPPAPPRIIWSNMSPVAPPAGAEQLPPQVGTPGQYTITNYLYDTHGGKVIYAGVLGSNPSQGVIIFEYWHGLNKVYLVPRNTGYVVLTAFTPQAAPVTVSFTTKSGQTGTINVASGDVTLAQ